MEGRMRVHLKLGVLLSIHTDNSALRPGQEDKFTSKQKTRDLVTGADYKPLGCFTTTPSGEEEGRKTYLPYTPYWEVIKWGQSFNHLTKAFLLPYIPCIFKFQNINFGGHNQVTNISILKSKNIFNYFLGVLVIHDVKYFLWDSRLIEIIYIIEFGFLFLRNFE